MHNGSGSWTEVPLALLPIDVLLTVLARVLLEARLLRSLSEIIIKISTCIMSELIKYESKKTRQVQKLAINKKSTFSVRSS